MLDAGVDGRIDDVGGAVDVVGDRFNDVLFHERHVLVGSGVEDGIRTEIVEYRVHSSAIADISDCRNDAEAGKSLSQFGLDIEYRIFAVAEYDEPGGFESGQLTAELAADGPAGACHEDRSALAQVPYSGKVGVDGIPAERRWRRATGQDVGKRRKGAGFETSVCGCLDDAADYRAGRGRDRDDNGAGVPVVCDATYVRNGAEHRDVIHAMIGLSVVVVNECDRVEPQLRISQQLLRDHLTSGACANDYCANVIGASALLPVPRADTEEKAGGDDERRRQQAINGKNRQRKPLRGKVKKWDN